MISKKDEENAIENPWYECQRCTNCCRWPGQVKLTSEDVTKIAKFLEMPEFDFVQTHTQLQPSRLGLALLVKEDGACAFLEGNDCLLQEVKPEQCKGFPNAWNFPGWQEICKAIPVTK